MEQVVQRDPILTGDGRILSESRMNSGFSEILVIIRNFILSYHNMNIYHLFDTKVSISRRKMAIIQLKLFKIAKWFEIATNEPISIMIIQ